MPRSKPQPLVAPAPAARRPAKPAPDAAPLPTDVPASPVDPSNLALMAQAHRDLAAGQVDTDMHNKPGLDAQRRAQLVPGPGGQPPGLAGDAAAPMAALQRRAAAGPAINPAINPVIDPPVNPPIDPPVSPPIDPPVSPQIDPPVSPPIDPPVSPQIDPPAKTLAQPRGLQAGSGKLSTTASAPVATASKPGTWSARSGRDSR